MKEKTKKILQYIGMGILIALFGFIGYYYNLIEPLDPNPFLEGL